MSGGSRLRASLQPLAWGFGALTGLRNRWYDWGLAVERGVGVPVISVGNLVAGGTGKTPFVEYLVRVLTPRVGRVAMVSRGYGRRSRGVVTVSAGTGRVVDAHRGGDEPVQLARKFPGLVVVVGENRVLAATHAAEDLGAEVIVLDDGFQHRSLRRDCNILLLDARTDISREPMLPVGYRREPRGGIRRADLVVFTRVDPASEKVAWESVVSRWYRGPVAFTQIVTEGFYRASDESRVESMEGRTCFAFSGIADHKGFVAGLRMLQINVLGDQSFSDHHPYSEADLDRLAQGFQLSKAELLLTTEKDLMRLITDEHVKQRACVELPLVYARVELRVMRGEETIVEMINRTLHRSAA